MEANRLSLGRTPARPAMALLTLLLLASTALLPPVEVAATAAAAAAGPGSAAALAAATGAAPLQALEVPVGKPNVTRSEWNEFLRDNLEADLAVWRQRSEQALAAARQPFPSPSSPPLNSSGQQSLQQLLLRGPHRPAPRRRGGLLAHTTLQLHADLMARLNLPSVVKLVLVYNNKFYFPLRTDDVTNRDPPKPVNPHMATFVSRLQDLMDTGKLRLPNVLFVLNVDDNDMRMCAPARKCPAPLLSLIKTVQGPGGTGGPPDTDVLLPQLLFSSGGAMHFYPWQLKRDVAFFRGMPYCSFAWWRKFPPGLCDNPCPRAYLAYRSHADQKAGRAFSYLDVALTDALEENITCIPDPPPPAAHVPLSWHAHHRYLLHLEGYTASSRLAQLFHINSLVLLQRQPFVEYYYRSLRPGVHYVPFWNTTSRLIDDIYDVVDEWRARERADPTSIQRIIREGNTFAIKFLGFAAQVRYVRDAVMRYKSLFADMDEYIADMVEDMRARGFF
ncbi:hypothetical protein CHLRE_16g692150v5 [Chlamydomonas reinhardtii]|uniref:Glycosyl transferase CAP10 domain-containing protein n=1 Tax=Chlamydomonas reinhardtii TaxID=3055 RepID=A0A2K3CSG5_CHLRE|nr:uncharacterized protein CHLRE_16g692150v5 [Chlamydomonas reinhardtii]XP_042915339.1 uncharacterized protein CHLRE_16g692150v5 [Chlamydomonas reinhardtii]PNW71233.1 hypothetical protein CHLRE_16g692150v5 [Chlamydomonas reinhardtii]PNW71234.1 hypothetical protein CHLRE_16g692150v5 [Chlamydomonas reinhardtii]